MRCECVRSDLSSNTWLAHESYGGKNLVLKFKQKAFGFDFCCRMMTSTVQVFDKDIKNPPCSPTLLIVFHFLFILFGNSYYRSNTEESGRVNNRTRSNRKHLRTPQIKKRHDSGVLKSVGSWGEMGLLAPLLPTVGRKRRTHSAPSDGSPLGSHLTTFTNNDRWD